MAIMIWSESQKREEEKESTHLTDAWMRWNGIWCTMNMVDGAATMAWTTGTTSEQFHLQVTLI